MKVHACTGGPAYRLGGFPIIHFLLQRIGLGSDQVCMTVPTRCSVACLFPSASALEQPPGFPVATVRSISVGVLFHIPADTAIGLFGSTAGYPKPRMRYSGFDEAVVGY